MKIPNPFVYNLCLPIIDYAKGMKTRKEYKLLKNIAGHDREYIRALQQKKLQKLIKHSYKTVLFYKNRFQQAGIVPDDIQSISDLTAIPLLTREDIQEHYHQLVSTKADLTKCYRGSSSGSTGKPVVYLHDKICSSAGDAARYFGWGLAGWNFGSSHMTIWGNPACVNTDWKKPASVLKSFLFNETKLAAYKLTDKTHFKKAVQLIKKGNFEYIYGYTNAIFLIANYAVEQNLQLPAIKGVFTTAENLMGYQRTIIEKALGPVYDFYGCGEINGIAFQCRKRDGYHLIDPHVIVEYGNIMDGFGNQELIITDLDNYAMPLIRYQNGDMGIPDDSRICDCGLGFSKISKVSGRVSDIVKTPDGGIFTVPSFFGSRLLKQIKGLVRYQSELVNHYQLIINIQTNDAFNHEQEDKIKEALNEYIPVSLKWKIKYTDEIKVSENGKFKIFIDRTKK